MGSKRTNASKPPVAPHDADVARKNKTVATPLSGGLRPGLTASNPEMDQFKQAGFDFVMTEINVGLTFATLALRADAGDSEKIHRELANARKAYESALKFQSKIAFTDEERDKLEQPMKMLRAALEKLNQRA